MNIKKLYLVSAIGLGLVIGFEQSSFAINPESTSLRMTATELSSNRVRIRVRNSFSDRLDSECLINLYGMLTEVGSSSSSSVSRIASKRVPSGAISTVFSGITKAVRRGADRKAQQQLNIQTKIRCTNTTDSIISSVAAKNVTCKGGVNGKSFLKGLKSAMR